MRVIASKSTETIGTFDKKYQDEYLSLSLSLKKEMIELVKNKKRNSTMGPHGDDISWSLIKAIACTTSGPPWERRVVSVCV